jgi:hypothetical protein
MIKEAEENADVDKSKKALVNITYELDNLIAKNELLLSKDFVTNNVATEYYSEILKEIKLLYKTNQLTKIAKESLDNLKYAYNVLIVDFFNKKGRAVLMFW